MLCEFMQIILNRIYETLIKGTGSYFIKCEQHKIEIIA
jgi:hypothetical protein